MQTVEWNWKQPSDDPQIGFIAEDVAGIMPGLVYLNEDGEVGGINYDLIVVPLVNAVKSQQARIEQLSNDLEQLKKDSGTLQGTCPAN